MCCSVSQCVAVCCSAFHVLRHLEINVGVCAWQSGDMYTFIDIYLYRHLHGNMCNVWTLVSRVAVCCSVLQSEDIHGCIYGNICLEYTCHVGQRVPRCCSGCKYSNILLYGVVTISRLLKTVFLFCKRAL